MALTVAFICLFNLNFEVLHTYGIGLYCILFRLSPVLLSHKAVDSLKQLISLYAEWEVHIMCTTDLCPRGGPVQLLRWKCKWWQTMFNCKHTVSSTWPQFFLFPCEYDHLFILFISLLCLCVLHVWCTHSWLAEWHLAPESVSVLLFFNHLFFLWCFAQAGLFVYRQTGTWVWMFVVK